MRREKNMLTTGLDPKNNDSLKKAAGIFFIITLLLSACAVIIPVTSASYKTQSMTINTIGTHATKVAMLNGVRYIFSHEGWGANQDYIEVFNATSSWVRDTSLVNSTYKYADIWVQTFPEIWDDLILVYGAQNNSAQAFFGYYNVTSNTFTLENNTKAYYFTQVYYIEELGIFYINPLNGEWKDQLLFSTPANLFNMSAWSNYSMGAFYHTDGEHMFAYNPADNLGYLIQWHLGVQDFYSVNMTTYALTSIMNNTAPDPAGRPRSYISSNDTTIFFSMFNQTVGEYFYYTQATGVVSIVNLTQPASSTEEWHLHNFPLGNLLLIGNVRDGSTASYYALYDVNGTQIQNFTGVRGHDSDNRPVLDNGKLVIGGEGGDAGGYSDVHYISTYASTTAFPKATTEEVEDSAILTLTPSASISNYVVRVTAINGSGDSANNTLYVPTLLNANFSDLRFTDSDTGAVLDVFNDTYAFNSGANATFHVRIPTLTSGTDYHLNVTWNNATQNLISNMSAVYPNGYDDFAGTLTDKWTVSDQTVNITSGALTMTDNNAEYGVYWKGTVNTTQLYEFWWMATSEQSSYNQWYFYFRGDQSSGHRHRIKFNPEGATDYLQGDEDITLSQVAYDFPVNTWIKVTIYTNGGAGKIWINDALIQTFTDDNGGTSRIAFGGYGNNAVLFKVDDFRISTVLATAPTLSWSNETSTPETVSGASPLIINASINHDFGSGAVANFTLTMTGGIVLGWFSNGTFVEIADPSNYVYLDTTTSAKTDIDAYNMTFAFNVTFGSSYADGNIQGNCSGFDVWGQEITSSETMFYINDVGSEDPEPAGSFTLSVPPFTLTSADALSGGSWDSSSLYLVFTCAGTSVNITNTGGYGYPTGLGFYGDAGTALLSNGTLVLTGLIAGQQTIYYGMHGSSSFIYIVNGTGDIDDVDYYPNNGTLTINATSCVNIYSSNGFPSSRVTVMINGSNLLNDNWNWSFQDSYFIVCGPSADYSIITLDWLLSSEENQGGGPVPHPDDDPTDSDGDGIPDTEDSYPHDFDNDGLPDDSDPDDDNDGTPDIYDPDSDQYTGPQPTNQTNPSTVIDWSNFTLPGNNPVSNAINNLPAEIRPVAVIGLVGLPILLIILIIINAAAISKSKATRGRTHRR